ncbi:cysteine hydrolase [Phenylobacterium sp. LjRoot164]|uniref:isochorismatase family cysteine hydrolase n=1 Tax=unclassified Phenylobacterium TaxID=2640670 RepID=UPI003ECF3E42
MASAASEHAAHAGPAPGATALLIVDMVNDFDFPDGDELLARAQTITSSILALRNEADRLGVPTFYVNDNYGHWRSERSAIVEACAREPRARDLVLRMAPRDHDYFVIKPRFSGFYATNLPVLLPQLGVSHLVLTGVAADICVLFTAADAHMRDYRLWIPEDAVASDNDERKAWALRIMSNSMGADTSSTEALSLQAWGSHPSP